MAVPDLGRSVKLSEHASIISLLLSLRLSQTSDLNGPQAELPVGYTPQVPPIASTAGGFFPDSGGAGTAWASFRGGMLPLSSLPSTAGNRPSSLSSWMPPSVIHQASSSSPFMSLDPIAAGEPLGALGWRPASSFAPADGLALVDIYGELSSHEPEQPHSIGCSVVAKQEVARGADGPGSDRLVSLALDSMQGVQSACAILKGLCRSRYETCDTLTKRMSHQFPDWFHRANQSWVLIFSNLLTTGHLS